MIELVTTVVSTAPLDPIQTLTNPIVDIVIASVAWICYYVISWSRAGNTLVLERLKPGWNVLRNATEKRTKNPGDITLQLPDKRKFTVPQGTEGDYETVYLPRQIRIKKGYRKLWILENEQLVKFSKDLADKASGLITPSMIPTILSRGSLGRLAAAKGIGSGGWTMIILAIGTGLAIGYIMYPQFNHPPPVIYCYQRLANGTLKALAGNCGIP